MATANCSGGSPPASVRSVRIRPAVRYGRLVHVLVGVAFPNFRAATSAWAAMQAGPAGSPAGGVA